MVYRLYSETVCYVFIVWDSLGTRNEEIDKEYWIVYFWFMHVCLHEINLDVIYL